MELVLRERSRQSIVGRRINNVATLLTKFLLDRALYIEEKTVSNIFMSQEKKGHVLMFDRYTQNSQIDKRSLISFHSFLLSGHLFFLLFSPLSSLFLLCLFRLCDAQRP